MNEKEILEYNKRCAEFLGWKNLNDDSFPEYVNSLGDFHPLRELKFHSDWNWIMEVLCKIEEIHHTVISQGITGHYININRKDVDIVTETLDNPSKFMGRGKTKKEAVVGAINQFLIWYEQNK